MQGRMAVIDAFSDEFFSAEKCHFTPCIDVYSALKVLFFFFRLAQGGFWET
jgi:hypothetical protein